MYLSLRDRPAGPSSAPANGPAPSPDNYLHTNAYPNAAAPGQTFECESGNEGFAKGKQSIGNVAGSQGTHTDGQIAGMEQGKWHR